MLSEKSYYIICSLKRNSSRISLSQLSVSYILRVNPHKEGKILDKNIVKLWANQVFVYNIDQIALFQILTNFANVVCICIFKNAKSANSVEIKWKK